MVGIGDDTAVLDMGGPEMVLATVDMLVESVHFQLHRTTLYDLGRRAIAVNVSDIAAMGGTPSYALVSLAVPESLPGESIESVYAGLASEASRSSIAIVGGNMSRIPGPFCIDLTLLGHVPRGEVVLRSGARVGDILVVTGTLGGSAARRLTLERSVPLDSTKRSTLDRIPQVPTSRVDVGRTLASLHIAHAMMDLSDGLAGDLHHLCDASDVGAAIDSDSLPISQDTKDLDAGLGIPAVELALQGGEDYELLIAMSQEDLERARASTPLCTLTPVGRITSRDDGVTMYSGAGGAQSLQPSGWKHF